MEEDDEYGDEDEVRGGAGPGCLRPVCVPPLCCVLLFVPWRQGLCAMARASVVQVCCVGLGATGHVVAWLHGGWGQRLVAVRAALQAAPPPHSPPAAACIRTLRARNTPREQPFMHAPPPAPPQARHPTTDGHLPTACLPLLTS